MSTKTQSEANVNIARHGSSQKDPAICRSQARPLYGVVCPSWIKWAGILENVFSFLLEGEDMDSL